MYTKDEWYVEEDEMEEMSILTIPEGEDFPDTIATVRLVGNFDGKEMMANAHLIAAAPKLYKALEKAQEDINWMLNNQKFLNPEVFDYVDKALAEVK